jgi:hypothetical protein
MAGAPVGGTTTNASSFSLNEDIKLPMGGRYQPTSSVGVFGGPQHTGMDAASTKNMVGKKMYYDSAGKGTLEYDRERMRSMEAEGIIPQHLLGGGLGGPMPMRRSGGPMIPEQGGMFNMGNTSANSFTKSRNEFEDVYAAAPMANTAMGGQPNGYARQATPNPNAQGFDSFRSNAGLPQPMPTIGLSFEESQAKKRDAAIQERYGVGMQGGIAMQAPMPTELRSNAGLPQPMPVPMPQTGFVAPAYNPTRTAMPFTQQERRRPVISQNMVESNLNSGVQQMAAPQQGGYNVNTASAQGLQQAQQGAAAEMGYRPMAVNSSGYGSTQVGPTGYSAAQMSGANLDPYMNPYENQVVQQSLDDLERSRLMAQNVGGAQAGAANAFGGSRQGIAEAETNRAFADQAARTASGLRQAGYDRSTQLAGQDIAALNQARQYGAGASNQASLSNQAAINQARQFGSTQNMQAQLANQAAGLSGAQQRLSAGSQLGNLSNLGFGMGQTIQGRMDQQGAMQQALNQQLINAAKGQYAGYTGAPAQSLQYLLQAVGGAPAQQQQTETYDAGLFDYLTLGAKAYASNPAKIGSMFGFGG